MKVFIDNTSLHRLYGVLTSKGPVHSNDLIALLHFAEHIMFGDGLEVSGFESERTLATSVACIDFLKSRLGLKAPFADIVSFSSAEYKDACLKAAPDLAQLISAIPASELIAVGELVNEQARPSGVTDLPLKKWLGAGAHYPQNFRDLASTALSRKALGSYDFCVARHEGLRNQLALVAQKADKKQNEVASSISIYFRAAINQNLAIQRSAIYSPAPRRAAILKRASDFLRDRFSAKLVKVAMARADMAAQQSLIKRLLEDKGIPLPIFAIHFLRRGRVRRPLDILEVAFAMREHKEVKLLRKWLKKLEKAYEQGDEKKRAGVLIAMEDALRQLEKDLQSNHSPLFTMFMVLMDPLIKRIRADLSIDMRLGEVSKDIESYFEVASTFKRRLLLATISNDILFNPKLGNEVYGMIGNRSLKFD